VSLDEFRQDLRFSLRTIRRSPGVMLLAVGCMALGIGAVTTMYGTATAFTLRPLPQVRGADRLMHVWEAPAASPSSSDGIAPGALDDLRALDAFSAVAGVADWEANIAGTDVPERVRAARVSAPFLRTLGRAPAIGRDFLEPEDAAGSDRVVLLTHGLWQRRFGGDPSLVGRTVRLNGEGYEVIGILPPDFVFPAGAELLVPLGLTPEERGSRSFRSLIALARRAPGVSEAQARAAVAALGARLAVAWPATNADWTLSAEPAEAWYGAGPRPFMIVLFASAVFVLLIACADVANLLLVRATARRREIAMRVALGASRGRIVRQLLTESVVIALVGGAFGVLLALWGLDALSSAVPVEIRSIIPGFGQLRLDWVALAVTIGVALVAGTLAGLAPALTTVRGGVLPAIQGGGHSDLGGRGAGRLRAMLVVAEVALALVLLTGATLMTLTFQRLALADPGFRPEGVLTLGVTLPQADYPDSTLRAFTVRLEDRLGELPGVLAAGATTVLPMAWDESRAGVEPEGRPARRPEEAPRIGLRRVSAGYLATVGIPVRRGRGLVAQDDSAGTPVALLSEAAARMLWPDEDAIGKRLRVRDHLVEIVGVVGNVRGNVLLTDDPLPVLYAPLRQWPSRSPTFVLRTAGEPTALADAARRAIAALDSRLAAGDVVSMPRVMLSAVSPQRATTQSLIVAAVVALVLAVVGTFGVLAYSVAQRTREIGVRMALGASAGTVERMVLRSAAALAAWGIGLGLLGALGMGRAMQAILYDTQAADPFVLGGAAVTLGAVSLAAGWLPARRAARVDPMEALRSE
jgi:putative ABC transport system permease protein